ncbi:hypothetical protein AB0J86_06510 [Micromonospora sp. NPDC049559]|uniref:hypothetical protein n=1 Tax=Micromonospora sp. NPDC049559 TaxID=3155923 RepID=UPI003426A123
MSGTRSGISRAGSPAGGAALSRRGLLIGTASVSAVGLGGVAAGPAGATPAGTAAAPPAGAAAGPMVARDRIATAVLRLPGGSLVAQPFQADLHERLAAWLAFWSANSPAGWAEPVEVVGRAEPAGAGFLLVRVRYRRDDRAHDGFSADRADAAYWATLASLHHHFPAVTPDAGGIRVADGAAGSAGVPERLAFAAAACRELWGYREATVADWQRYANRALRRAGQTADIASRAGWATFTRTSLRLGLGTESY